MYPHCLKINFSPQCVLLWYRGLLQSRLNVNAEKVHRSNRATENRRAKFPKRERWLRSICATKRKGIYTRHHLKSIRIPGRDTANLTHELPGVFKHICTIWDLNIAPRGAKIQRVTSRHNDTPRTQKGRSPFHGLTPEAGNDDNILLTLWHCQLR